MEFEGKEGEEEINSKRSSECDFSDEDFIKRPKVGSNDTYFHAHIYIYLYHKLTMNFDKEIRQFHPSATLSLFPQYEEFI